MDGEWLAALGDKDYLLADRVAGATRGRSTSDTRSSSSGNLVDAAATLASVLRDRETALVAGCLWLVAVFAVVGSVPSLASNRPRDSAAEPARDVLDAGFPRHRLPRLARLQKRGRGTSRTARAVDPRRGVVRDVTGRGLYVMRVQSSRIGRSFQRRHPETMTGDA